MGQHSSLCVLLARQTAACSSEMLRLGRLRVCQDSSGRIFVVHNCMRDVVRLRALPCAGGTLLVASPDGFSSNILAALQISDSGQSLPR